MTRAAIYTRTASEDTEQIGAMRQVEECQRLCQENQWDVAAVVGDSASGNDNDRPGWGRLLNMVKGNEVDIVVAWQASRLTRSAEELKDFSDLAAEHGVGIATVQQSTHTTPEEAAMARIFGLLEEHESEQRGRE
ncbi:Resolvase, N terminal domain [Promicromonospora umidemergens]|uniref:Resolvase/invertase-type recombinase catalytic domain-containing protein n=1 Tax=Promicromonospora umidemergens TaxID=629679 RepID=A0ABP8YDN3_9MICO|nr:recombinase family protein [Promicromonospora umidemergens]MCP2286625.1 Resolvase, N terminal domain [Promicromonospora umidemergens]